MYRLTKNENLYHEYRKTEKGCYFCEPESHVVLLKFKNFYISKNNFPYDFWDSQKVLEHLLIVSKEHLSTLNSKNKDVVLEYADLINKYSNKGFDIYLRAKNSPSRSQVHFHTHLIKTDGKKIKSLKFDSNPYILSVKE